MANFKESTGIANISYADWYLQQKAIYFNTFTDNLGASYIHLKTSIPKQSSVMSMLEAIGYNFGPSQPIRCSWAFYTYAAVSDPYSVGLQNTYNGLIAHGVYYSSDNYTCIRAYNSSSTYYCGFTVDVYATAGANPGYPVSITAAAQNTNSGNYY